MRILWATLLAILIGLLCATRIGEQPVPPKGVWEVSDSKRYAKQQVTAMAVTQWKCLNILWVKESNWRSNAYNKRKVMGRNAGGIPQILGLNPDTHPRYQIDRGLAYIVSRYLTPCKAWEFHKRNGWY